MACAPRTGGRCCAASSDSSFTGTAEVCDLTVYHRDNPIDTAQGSVAVFDHDDRALSHDRLQQSRPGALRFRVELGDPLVDDEQADGADQGTGAGDDLHLPLGQEAPVRADHRVEPVG